MKTTFIAAAAAAAAMFVAAPASAWEGTKVACYDKHWVPASYSTSKKLKKPAKYTWEHVDGQMVKMYYPPVYIEEKSLNKAGHWVMREAACN